ncbi:MAG: preprotein translocase subunit SecG [Aeoliella sp.]
MELLFKILLFVIALFMILLILVQKGRGGGLAGALGGPGGSSAFGAKAGDAFTKITAYTALLWMAVCISATLYFASGGGAAGGGAKLEGIETNRPAGAAAPLEEANDGAGESADGAPVEE